MTNVRRPLLIGVTVGVVVGRSRKNILSRPSKRASSAPVFTVGYS